MSRRRELDGFPPGAGGELDAILRLQADAARAFCEQGAGRFAALLEASLAGMPRWLEVQQTSGYWAVDLACAWFALAARPWLETSRMMVETLGQPLRGRSGVPAGRHAGFHPLRFPERRAGRAAAGSGDRRVAAVVIDFPDRRCRPP